MKRILLNKDNGKKYSIEIHHAPFTLFELVDIVLTKKEKLNEKINPYYFRFDEFCFNFLCKFYFDNNSSFFTIF